MLVLFALVGCSEFGLNQMSHPQPGADVDEARDTAAVDTTEGDTATDDSATTTDSAEPDSATPPDTAVDDPAPADDCTETDDLIYVVSRDNPTLYTFDPASLTFTSLGRLACGTSQTPGSMAVSRAGTAYVRYADNALYEVDLTTLACAPSTYSDHRTGFDSFGMGYVTDSADTWREQLYVANSQTLGTLDTSTGSITSIGSMPSQSELTGNAAGELWAILPLEHPAELRQVDLTDGHKISSVSLPGFPDPSNIDTFAFATWSGDFYVFVRESGLGNTTDVYKVTSAGAMTRVLSDVGFDVVGAGVSTCAPS